MSSLVSVASSEAVSSDGEDKSQASWSSYEVNGSNFLFRESYLFFQNLYYPKSYGNPMNYFISQTHRCNNPEILKNQKEKCSLAKDEDDVKSMVMKQDESSDDSTEGDFSEAYSSSCKQVSGIEDSEDLYLSDVHLSAEVSSETNSSDVDVREENSQDEQSLSEIGEKSRKASSEKLVSKDGSVERDSREKDSKLILEYLSVWKKLKWASMKPEASTYRAVYTSSGESVYQDSDEEDFSEDLPVPEDFVKCVWRKSSEDDVSCEENSSDGMEHSSEDNCDEEGSIEEHSSDDDHKPPSIILEKWWITQSQPQPENKVEKEKEKEKMMEIVDPKDNEEKEKLKAELKLELFLFRKERHQTQKMYQKQIRANAEEMKQMMKMTPEELKQLVRGMNLFGDAGDDEPAEEEHKKDEKGLDEKVKYEMDGMELDVNEEEEQYDLAENLDEENLEEYDEKEKYIEEEKTVEEAEKDTEEKKYPDEEQEQAEDVESNVLSVHTSEIDIGDVGTKGVRKVKHTTTTVEASNEFTSKEDFEWSTIQKRGMYVFSKICQRRWCVKADTCGAEVTQMPKVIQLDRRFTVKKLPNDHVGDGIPFYPEHLHKRLIPYEYQMIFYDPINISRKKILFFDPWHETYSRIRAQSLDDTWEEIALPYLIDASIELKILELKTLRSEACFDGENIRQTIEHFLIFCKTMESFDFYDEHNLEKFKNFGGCHMLKDFLHYEHMDAQMASLGLLERFTKTTKYAEHVYDIYPQIVGFLQSKFIKLSGSEQELNRSMLSVMLLKNISRCDTAKKDFETDRYLGSVFLSLDSCLNILARKYMSEAKRDIAFYYAGVSVEILSNASDKESSKLKISRQLHLTKNLKQFLLSPLFQNDALFLCKNMSTFESHRLVMFEQKFLSCVQDLLQHYMTSKELYRITEMVRNMLESPRFVDFILPDEMVEIVTGLVLQNNRLGVYESSEEFSDVFLELLQSFVHKYNDESCVNFFIDIRIVQHLMRNLCGLVKHYFRHCSLEKQDGYKSRIELRVDILDRLVEHEDIRHQFNSLEPLVKLFPMGQLELYPKTFRKVLRMMRGLGIETHLKLDFYKLQPKFWIMFLDQNLNGKIRLEAALRISEVYTNQKTLSMSSCLQEVIVQLRPLSDSTNDSILEGFCTILNKIFLNFENLEQHFEIAHQQEHLQDCENRILCEYCQALDWMTTILKRVNMKKQVSPVLLQNLMEFFKTVTSTPPIGQLILRNDMLSLLKPHVHSTVHTIVMQVFNQLTQLEPFLSGSTAEKKKALWDINLIKHMLKIFKFNRWVR